MAHANYAEQCRLLWSILNAKIMKIFRNAVILPMKVFCDARSHNRSLLVNL